MSRNTVLSFDPKEFEEDESDKFGQSLKNLAEEDVTIDNYENFMQRISTYCGQIKDDIIELQKEISRIDSQLEKLKNDVGEERIKGYRDNNKDLVDFSVDKEDSLAYRRLKKLKKIENKRSYKSAHWRLLAVKLEEILGRLGSIDSVVKNRTESVKAEILKELENSERAVIDSVEQSTDALGRDHGQIQRLSKSNIQLTQEISQHLSVGADSILTDGMMADESEESEDDSGESGLSNSSEEVIDNTESSTTDSDLEESGDSPKLDGVDYELPFEFKDKDDKEKRDELNRMVDLVDDIGNMSKSEIVDLVDVSRQQFYYAGDGGTVGRIESMFGVQYPELK